MALAAALPSTLENLGLAEVGCGDAGMMALVAALPRLTSLSLNDNQIGDAGMRALAAAVAGGGMAALTTMYVDVNPGYHEPVTAALLQR